MARHDDWTGAQRTTSVTVDGHQLSMAYYEAGRDNDGPPVVFLHGIPTWSYLWRDVAPALAETRHVVAPDLVGYGNSAMYDGFDRSIRAQEQALGGLLAHLDAETVSLVAHDIGGGVALRRAVHEPDTVERLVLSNATAYDSWPVPFINSLGVPSEMDQLSQGELDEKLEFAFAGGLYGDEANPEFVEGMKAPWQGAEARTSLSRNAVATNTSHTTELDYGAVTAETLLLWGADDVLQPIAYAERLAEDVAGDAELTSLDDAYHWVVEDRTEAYVAHLREFLG